MTEGRLCFWEQVLDGVYGFVAQLNEGRATKKRPTEYSIDKVVQARCRRQRPPPPPRSKALFGPLSSFPRHVSRSSRPSSALWPLVGPSPWPRTTLTMRPLALPPSGVRPPEVQLHQG